MRTALQRYYTPREVTGLLAVSYKTVCRLIHARTWPGTVNLGSELRPDYRVPADEIGAYLERRRVFLEKAA